MLVACSPEIIAGPDRLLKVNKSYNKTYLKTRHCLYGQYKAQSEQATYIYGLKPIIIYLSRVRNLNCFSKIRDQI
jgi:hypothetical protein